MFMKQWVPKKVRIDQGLESQESTQNIVERKFVQDGYLKNFESWEDLPTKYQF
jgi:hypothetical protein